MVAVDRRGQTGARLHRTVSTEPETTNYFSQNKMTEESGSFIKFLDTEELV